MIPKADSTQKTYSFYFSHPHYSVRLQWPEHQGDLAPMPYFECHTPFEAEACQCHPAPTFQ